MDSLNEDSHHHGGRPLYRRRLWKSIQHHDRNQIANDGGRIHPPRSRCHTKSEMKLSNTDYEHYLRLETVQCDNGRTHEEVKS